MTEANQENLPIEAGSVPVETGEAVPVPDLGEGVYPVVIGDKVYKMALAFDDMADSEHALLLKGENAQVLLALLNPFAMASIRRFFAVSIYKHHPEIPFAEAEQLVGLGHMVRVGLIIKRELDRSSGVTGGTLPVDSSGEAGPEPLAGDSSAEAGPEPKRAGEFDAALRPVMATTTEAKRRTMRPAKPGAPRGAAEAPLKTLRRKHGEVKG